MKIHEVGKSTPDMNPPEHFLVALLPVLAYVVVRDRRLPSLRLVAVVGLGSQFPDLIDKSLAYQLGLIPSGRVFMHSLPTALPFLLGVGYYAWKTDRRRLGGAFTFAHLSHLFADFYTAFLGPTRYIPPELLWPLGPPVARRASPHWAGPGSINVHLWTLFSLVVLSITVYLLIIDVRKQLKSR